MLYAHQRGKEKRADLISDKLPQMAVYDSDKFDKALHSNTSSLYDTKHYG
jgi:hypothetical protein